MKKTITSLLLGIFILGSVTFVAPKKSEAVIPELLIGATIGLIAGTAATSHSSHYYYPSYGYGYTGYPAYGYYSPTYYGYGNPYQSGGYNGYYSGGYYGGYGYGNYYVW